MNHDEGAWRALLGSERVSGASGAERGQPYRFGEGKQYRKVPGGCRP
jgi:hypothetical protein